MAKTPTQLVARSHRLGADPRNTNFAGGNTSAQGQAIDPVTGKKVNLLWVKGSGGDLGTLTEDGLAVLELDRVRALVDVYPGLEREDEMVAAFDYCAFGKGGAAPSIDTAMHALVESNHVESWEAPTYMWFDGDAWVCHKVTPNEEFGYMRSEISKKYETWVQSQGGERSEYASSFEMVNGEQVLYADLNEWFERIAA